MKSLAFAGLIAALLLSAPGASLATTIPESTVPDIVPEDSTGEETGAEETGAEDPASDETVSTSTVLNVLGTGITLDVELDPTGRLSSVSLVEPVVDEPAAPDGETATPDGEAADDPALDDDGGPLDDTEVAHRSGHKVRILLGDDGTSVEVQAGGNKVDTKVRTADLAGLVGSHSWSGELFGPGNGLTTVGFTVADDGGFPELTLDTVDTDATFSERTWTEADDGGYEAKLRVDLTDGADKARVVVTVSVDLDEDDGPRARLKISAHSRLLATERPGGPADDPDLSIGDDEDDDEDESEGRTRGRSEDKRQDDRRGKSDADDERGEGSKGKDKGQDDEDHDDDSDDDANDDDDDHDDDDHDDDSGDDDDSDHDDHDGDHD